jgi:protein-S-isoprenylcysteine O-methyltransferase Ste14
MRLFVWTGGALFAGSLALTAWTYGVVFARGLPFHGWPDTLSAALVDTLLFSCFAVHHSLLSRDWFKAQIVHVIPTALLRSVYVWVASALLIAVDLLWRPVGGVLYRVPFPAAWLGVGVQMIGLWLTIRAARAIDPLDLAGIRESTLPTELQVGGPYGVVRHPLYFGWTLVVFGTPGMTADRLVFALVSTAYLAIAIPFEERSLIRHFGQQYQRYRGRVRWRMIPFVY